MIVHLYACLIAGTFGLIMGLLFIHLADPLDDNEDRFWYRLNIARGFGWTGIGSAIGGFLVFAIKTWYGLP